MIVATAGHVDHGKTLLVKALTGIDTDRLPEEKKRGLTIDLGFAYLPLDDGPTIGFVDVPGHEHFVRNMVAGVTGIDHALLIVAADDGIMPQTVEHLAILELLEVSAGTAVVTKADKVDAARLAEVEADVAALLQPTGLAGAPVLTTSALTGSGLVELRAHLEAAARAQAQSRDCGLFRLAIDRAFTIEGAGLVVTGSVHAGEVAVNDQLVLSPRGTTVRVRGLYADNARAERAGAGHRCAVNIAGAGLGRDDVHRGDWLVAPALHHPSARLDARLSLLASERGRLGHGRRVHLHLGTADVVGRVVPLEGGALEPGGRGLAQIVLEAPIGALHGDRLILRDRAAARTIGGGVVLDPFAPARGRARPERLARLSAMDGADPEAALSALLAASPGGVDLDRFAVARNLDDAALAALLARLAPLRLKLPQGRVALSPAHWEALRGALLAALEGHHRGHPDEEGLAEAALRARLALRPSAALLAAALDALAAAGDVRRRGGLVSRAGHEPRLGAADARLWQSARAVIAENDLRPTTAGELARALGLDDKKAAALLRRLARHGSLVLIARHRVLLPDALARLAAIAERLAAAAPDGLFAAAAYRDAAGIGRNQTIQVLEYFDEIRFTARIGDGRRIARPYAGAVGDT